jgi:hypothetical protein
LWLHRTHNPPQLAAAASRVSLSAHNTRPAAIPAKPTSEPIP